MTPELGTIWSHNDGGFSIVITSNPYEGSVATLNTTTGGTSCRPITQITTHFTFAGWAR